MTQTNDIKTPNNSVGKKDNKAFMILSALGILFVVDEHLGRPISFLYDIFPYDSFYMPLFMFISGYFFNTKHCSKFKNFILFSWNKIKKMLTPYLLWIVFYGIFTSILRALGIINFGKVSISLLIHRILTYGTAFGFNDPSWFVPALFCVCVFYCLIRTFFKRIWNDTLSLLFFVLMGAYAVYLSNTGFNIENHYYILKIMFFLQFYHLGFFFKKHIEKFFDKIPTILVCISTICINIVLLSIYQYDIRFPYCARMAGFFTNNLFLPLITSVTAIAFWLKISKILAPALGNNKLVNFISDNTFFIMTHHLTANALFNGLLILLKKFGVKTFSAIDAVQFKKTAWYVFYGSPWCTLTGFLFTMLVTLFALQLFLFIKKRFFLYTNNLLQSLKK